MSKTLLFGSHFIVGSNNAVNTVMVVRSNRLGDGRSCALGRLGLTLHFVDNDKDDKFQKAMKEAQIPFVPASDFIPEFNKHDTSYPNEKRHEGKERTCDALFNTFCERLLTLKPYLPRK